MITKNQIKYFKQLQQKRCRDTENLYIIEGIKMVNDALMNHSSDIKFIISTLEALPQIIEAEERTIEVVPFEIIKKISSLKTPQPVIAVMHIPVYEEKILILKDEIVIALDKIKDPGNLGTIIRLADWFGVEKIFCSENSVDCYNPKVVQASMGAIFRVQVHYCNLKELFHVNKNACIYGTLMSGESIFNTNLKLPAVLLMGNESDGISPELLNDVQRRIHIPNFSKKQAKTESLNVSVATSIVLSELRRKQHYSK